MMVLSVVVPVYLVPQYLLTCLDSVVTDLPPDVEVIAVDDRSPDECGQMLDEYAASHPALSVIHLGENVGLGPARNVGLARATGEYVWFVDSDDWLAPGSVAAVVERLRTTRPDVLLLDHVRVYDDGREELDPSSRLLREPPLPGVVTLAERPDLLRLQHTAWNRVVRRAFLDELGLRFHRGLYEDFPFSHPVVIAADRIAVLDRVCYCYRQRDGAITKTPSPRVFEVFDQYERLFDLLDKWQGTRPDFRAAVFDRMVEHYLVIVGNNDRVPHGLRRAFFRRIVEHYRRYRPRVGYAAPGGLRGMRHLLVRWNAFRAYAALRGSYRFARRVRAGVRPEVPSARPGG